MDTIAVIGLGYVGLPLAAAFGRTYETIGFDVNAERVEEITRHFDRTLECNAEELRGAKKLRCTTRLDDLRAATVYIVTVPTPVDPYNRPDLGFLLRASEMVGQVLSRGDTVIYESTVYPGCTEEDCVPVLERSSGLKFNQDFFCGYSPERINPGDHQHRLSDIVKVVSGSTPEVARRVQLLYESIITAGTHLAPSIRVAEAAKVIENTQRDLNIAFVNELALIFDRMGVDTNDVLAAAATKWNFLGFRPGLVGGHCIGVDPYYLTHKAEGLGYHPHVILVGRRVNDNMGLFIAGKFVKLLISKNIAIKNARVLILGITFKENCPDIRNSGVVAIVQEMRSFGARVDVFDPWANAREVKDEYDIDLVTDLPEISGQADAGYDGIILAVAHDQFKNFEFRRLKKANAVIYDVKGILPRTEVDGRL